MVFGLHKMDPKATKIDPETDQNRKSNIKMDLVRKNPNQDAPKTPQLGAQDGPRAAQEAPKTPQEPPKSCPKGAREAAQRCLGARRTPKSLPEPPKSSPDPSRP